jgi:hypothetical protein
VFPFVVSRSGHPGEKRRGLAIAQQVEQHRRAGAFPVIIVPWPRLMIAVGNGALVDVVTQEPCRLVDRLVDSGIIHARLAGKHQREGNREPRLVHATIAIQVAVRPGELVTPRAHHALCQRRFLRSAFELRQDRLVAGGQDILGQEQAPITVKLGSGVNFGDCCKNGSKFEV